MYIYRPIDLCVNCGESLVFYIVNIFKDDLTVTSGPARYCDSPVPTLLWAPPSMLKSNLMKYIYRDLPMPYITCFVWPSEISMLFFIFLDLSYFLKPLSTLSGLAWVLIIITIIIQ